jgi:hypothetical protein
LNRAARRSSVRARQRSNSNPQTGHSSLNQARWSRTRVVCEVWKRVWERGELEGFGRPPLNELGEMRR